MNYYLAIDFGASSGRHILCHVENGKLVTEEIHRFENGAVPNADGTLCWEIDRLFGEIKAGMKKCADLGKIPVSMGIDTWGVDYVLLGADGKRLGDAVSYRDGRTQKAADFVNRAVSSDERYAKTGIQSHSFNTIYQLASCVMDNADYFADTKHLLMLPDYFNYLLTGKIMQEYTNATTTELVNAHTQDWDDDIIKKLGLPRKMFKDIKMPSTVVGRLLPQISAEVGFDTKVVLTASHDTSSAIMAIPLGGEGGVYISSGTWSLMGIELKEPDCRTVCRDMGLSNEGGYRGITLLENIMGLWIIQQVRHEYNDGYSFAELCELAEKSDNDSIVDCNDEMFLSPMSMKGAICDYCTQHGMKAPEEPGDYARITYRSLAKCYAECANQLENLTGRHYDTINIIGGGSNADYLNRLTAEVSGKTVCAGPSEATAIGNIAAQMIACGEIKDLMEFKGLVSDTFEIKRYN